MSMPTFSYCNAREQHVTRTGHTDGDDIVAPGPRAYNPAQLMIVACVPGIFFETVVKTPGLSSPCIVERGEGLVTALGLGFTPHIQCQAGTDLPLCAYAVDVLLHLAIAPVAAFHGIRGRGQQLVVEKR